MKKLLSFEALERELKYIDLPYIDIASGVRTRLNSKKRKFIRVSRNIIKTAAILAAVLVIGSVGIYNSTYRAKQNKLKAAKIQLANELKEKEAQDKLAKEAENQKDRDINELFKYVNENENVIIGYTSNPNEYYNLYNSFKIKDLVEAKNTIEKEVKDFTVLPYGYKFEQASILYDWNEQSKEIREKYIQEAIKNKEKIFKIPLIRGDKIQSIDFNFYKEYPTFRISITKSYMPKSSKVTFYSSNKEEKVKIADREISISNYEHFKTAKWIESFEEYSISYYVNVPKDYTIEDIEKIIKEIEL